MNIEFSQFKTEVIKNLFERADLDGTGSLNTEEVSIFQQEYDKIEDKTPDMVSDYFMAIGNTKTDNEATDINFASVSENTLKDTTVRLKGLKKVSMLELLQFDYLNYDLAFDENKLKEHLKKQYPAMQEEKLDQKVKEDMAERQSRFNKDSDGKWNGTYNLEKLYKSVTGSIGIDDTENQSNNKQISEKNSAAGHLLELQIFSNGTAGLEEFYKSKGIKARKYDKVTDNVTDQLVKFFKRTVEGNRHKIAEAFGRGAKNGIPAAVGTGAAALISPANSVEIIQNNLQVSTLDWDINELTTLVEQARDRIAQMPEADARKYLDSIFGKEAYQFNRQSIPYDVRLINCLTNIGLSLGISIATAVLKDIIIGEPREFETAVIGTHPFNLKDHPKETSDVEAYKAAVDKSNKLFPKGTKETMKALADMFVAEDNCGNKVFGYEYLCGYLHSIGGEVLNAAEFASALTSAEGQERLKTYIKQFRDSINGCCDKQKPEPVEQNKPVQPRENEEQPELPQPNEQQVDNKKGEIWYTETPYEIDTVKSLKDGGTKVIKGWGPLRDAYTDCFDKYFENGGVIINNSRDWTERRVMKLIQGINDGNFSQARITELLNMVKTGKLTRNNHPKWFNYDAYVSALNGRPGDNTIVPEHILYVKDVKISELSDGEKAEYCIRGEFGTIKPKPDGSGGSGGSAPPAAERGTDSLKRNDYYERQPDGTAKRISADDYAKKRKQTDKYVDQGKK